MPWQNEVEPRGILKNEDIDRLNLFVNTAIMAFFDGKLDLTKATAEDFRKQLGDDKTGIEFTESVRAPPSARESPLPS